MREFMGLLGGPFTGLFRKNGKHTIIEGYVIEILIIIRDVLRNVVPNLSLVLNFMRKFTNIFRVITLQVD